MLRWADSIRSAFWAQELERRHVVMGSGLKLLGRPIVRRYPASRIELGSNVVLTSKATHTALAVNHAVVLRTLCADASIIIGDNVGISGGSICAAIGIAIGSGTLLGANVTIVDTDFHPIASSARRYARMPDPTESDRVMIGNNVFLGTNVSVLKGVKIGDNAVIGASSVVTHDVGPNSIVAGSPAREVGTWL